jgi:hypothetical protein
VAERFKLQQLDLNGVRKLREEWKALVEDEVFQLELGQVLQFAEESISSGTIDSPAFFALVEKKTKKTHAVLDIIQGTKKRALLTKLLKIVLSPVHWQAKEDSDDLAEVFAESVIHTISHGVEDSVNKTKGRFAVKIYGRTDPLFDVLFSTYKVLQSKKLPNLQVSIEGRWLCVSTK